LKPLTASATKFWVLAGPDAFQVKVVFVIIAIVIVIVIVIVIIIVIVVVVIIIIIITITITISISITITVTIIFSILSSSATTFSCTAFSRYWATSCRLLCFKGTCSQGRTLGPFLGQKLDQSGNQGKPWEKMGKGGN
jgi:hypothetical protein